MSHKFRKKLVGFQGDKTNLVRRSIHSNEQIPGTRVILFV